MRNIDHSQINILMVSRFLTETKPQYIYDRVVGEMEQGVEETLGTENRLGGEMERDNQDTDNQVGRDQPKVDAQPSTSQKVATPVASEPVPDRGHYKPIVMHSVVSVDLGPKLSVEGMAQALELAHQSEETVMGPPWVTPKPRKQRSSWGGGILANLRALNGTCSTALGW